MKAPHPRSARPHHRLHLEPLEDRVVPSSVAVPGESPGLGALEQEYSLSGSAAAAFVVPEDMHLVGSLQVSDAGLTYERYQQTFGEAEVLGGQVTLYRDAEGDITTVIGAYYTGITPANSVQLGQGVALAQVQRDVGPGEHYVDLLIDPATGSYYYQVETRTFEHRWFHLVDPGSGQVVSRYDALANLSTGYGVAYDDGDTTDVKDLTGLTTQSGSTYLLQSEDGRQETHDQGSTRRPFAGPIASDSNDIWDLPGNTSPAQPALVDAQYYARVTDDFYLDALGFDWVAAGQADPDLPVQVMVLHAHYSNGYSNAVWSGSYVLLGDGDQVYTREYTSLDVIGHELTHGVTDFTSNLIYQGESGALNEAFSDIMGTTMEFWAEANGREPAATLEPDWLLGEDIDLVGNGFRNMADPEEDGQPDHYSELVVTSQDNGGVHINSGIPNHAYYLLVNGGLNASAASPSDHSSAHVTGAEQPVVGIGLQDAATIFFQAFIALPSNADMADARDATVAVAASLFGAASQQALSTAAAWEAVGVGVAAPPDTTAPAVQTVSPADGATVSGQTVIQVQAADDRDAAGTLTVEVRIDDGAWAQASYNAGSGRYEYTWNTAAVANGAHTISARATDGSGNVGVAGTVTAEVSNTATAVSVTGISPNSVPPGSTTSVTITGSGFQPGATVTFVNGSGPAPTVSAVTVVSENTITLTVTVKNGGPRQDRVWDVLVTNPDGSSATLVQALTVSVNGFQGATTGQSSPAPGHTTQVFQEHGKPGHEEPPAPAQVSQEDTTAAGERPTGAADLIFALLAGRGRKNDPTGPFSEIF